MKIFQALIVLLFLFSCTNNSKTVETSKTTYKDEIKKSITKYLEVNIEKSKEKLHIDDIEILKIDTLTDKSILYSKFNTVAKTLELKLELVKLHKNDMELKTSMGVFKDKTLERLALEKSKKLLDDANEESRKADDIREQIENNPDSTTFRYYLVTTKLTGTGKDMVQETTEIQNILNRDYRIIKPEDIYK